MDHDLERRARDVGLSVDDYIYMHESSSGEDEEAEEEGEAVSAEIKIPLWHSRKSKKMVANANMGVLASDPAFSKSAEPLMEFIQDTTVALRSQQTTASSALLPAPFDNVPQRRQADFRVETPGQAPWKLRSGVSYVFGVSASDAQNAYGIPPGATIAIYPFEPSRKPPRKYFFSKSTVDSSAALDSEAFFGLKKTKKKKRPKTGSAAVKPFRVTATDIPSPGDSRLFVMPQEAVERRSFAAIFSLSPGRTPGGFLNADAIRAAGGVAIAFVGPDSLDLFAIFEIPPLFQKTPLVTGAGSGAVLEGRQTQSSSTDAKGERDEEVSRMYRDKFDERLARARKQEQVFEGVINSVGQRQMEKWEDGTGRYLGEAMAKMQREPRIAGVTHSGSSADRRFANLALLSETVRSGIGHMIDKTDRYRRGLTGEMAIGMASSLLQTVAMLRWTIFGLLKQGSHATPRRKWIARRGMAVFDIDGIAQFPVSYFVLDFSNIVEKAAEMGEADHFVPPLRDFHVRLIESTIAEGENIRKSQGGTAAMALVLRNVLLADLSLRLSATMDQWPSQLEALAFVLTAAAAVMAKRASVDEANVRQAIFTTLTMAAEPAKLLSIHNTLVDAFTSARKEKPGRQTRSLPAATTGAGKKL